MAGEDHEALEATDKKQMVKHLDLNSLTANKMNGGGANKCSRRHKHGVFGDSEEDEMTQMSCGMNIRETFREVDSQNYHLKTQFNATQCHNNKMDTLQSLIRDIGEDS